MKLNKIISGLVGVTLLGLSSAGAVAAEEGATPHYPINHPRHAHWSFAGPFGHWDVGQLQRGLKIYKEVCSACHSMRLVPFRALEALGYSEEQVKAFAAEYTVTDGPNAEGEMYERPGVPADYFPSPFPNEEAAAYANNGAAPPDFSLIAKARAPERGFPTFIFDIFTLYAENGPDYIYSLLTGYQEPPAGVEVADGTHYNPYFVGGSALAMANPLSDGIVTYDDGSPETVDQYAHDISAFLMWAAEPSLVERKSIGFRVMIFLLLLAALTYLTKKKIWSSLHGEPEMVTARAGGDSPKAAAKAAAGSVAMPAVSMPAAASEKKLRAGVDFIDDVELIDGIGATIAKRLRSEGYGSLVKLAALSENQMAKLAEKVNASKRYIREEWQIQARELIAGKPPRAQIDREKVEKMLNKSF